MDVEVSKVCIGVQYKNLWYVKEVEHLKECSLQFWLYWEVLQAATMKIPHLSEEAIVKYQWIVQFAMGPHEIHVQARREPDKQWLSTYYSLNYVQMDSILDDWHAEWQEPVSEDEVSDIVTVPPADAPVDTLPDQ